MLEHKKNKNKFVDFCNGDVKGEETTAAASNTEVNEELKGDLGFAIWDNNLMDYIDQNDMAGKFQETYPNVNIEVEKIKDDSEYWNAMKMRASANQLPDVMFNKPFTLSRFKDYLIDLSGLDATKNNELAAGYALDGKILGIPMTAGYEYVYYWKDMFEEAGVEVPTTWDQLKEVSWTLQDYYGKDNPDFMAIALGAKDEWPDYPFMEFMPALEGGNGQNWNDMAKTDAPFAADTDIAKAYQVFSPKAEWNGSNYTNVETGVKLDNVFLVYQDTYIMGDPGHFMGSTKIEVPEKYFTIK